MHSQVDGLFAWADKFGSNVSALISDEFDERLYQVVEDTGAVAQALHLHVHSLQKR